MRIDTTFLRSKVARRIFVLFVLCTLLPIAALVILSFSQVTRQLNQQSQSRLRQATKATGMGIYERLLFLEGELRVIAPSVAASGKGAAPITSTRFREDASTGFVGVVILADTGKQLSLFGRLQEPPGLSASEKEYLRSGHTLVSSQSSPEGPARIFMSRMLDPEDPGRGIVIGEINTTFLWDIGEQGGLPYLTELCVLDQSNAPLYCSPNLPASFPAEAARRLGSAHAGQFVWKGGEEEFLASYWSLVPPAKFGVRKWIVMLTLSKADILSPMAEFKKTFPLIILLTLWVVLLLSIGQIRRSLVPLEKLREGTERLAKSDFASRVAVTSGDEFEELATSFNLMASRLGRQFHALSVMGEIDRAILASLDTRKIVDTVLTRIWEVSPCDCVSVILQEAGAASIARAYVREGGAGGVNQEEDIQLLQDEMQRLEESADSLVVMGEGLPHYLAPLGRLGIRSALVLPVLLKERVTAIIALGHRTPYTYSEEDVLQVRRLANQVGVALSNAHLIEELNQLNWGTLIALARTIDAKSAWTAGHSERVTELALRIGWVLGLSQKELDALHRGGLLHDIGKIGIPPEILDKMGRLTVEESEVMRRHVRIGARILEPVAAYAHVIPIILQHHEWFDGSGYPDGLSGEAISLGGRIFAVADSFDALTSDRPYRGGLGRERAIEIIKEGAGGQFDPKVVQAFLSLMDQEGRTATDQAEGDRAPSRHLRKRDLGGLLGAPAWAGAYSAGLTGPYRVGPERQR
jgi:putative nucleotidyltransferase with HDIG domain